MKVQLVDDVRDWSHWWSMRWIIATTFFTGALAAYAILPATLLPVIPDAMKVFLAVGAVFSSGASGVARVLKQPNL